MNSRSVFKAAAAALLAAVLWIAAPAASGASDAHAGSGQYIDGVDYIKVGLYYGSSSKTSVTVSCGDGFIVYSDALEETGRLDPGTYTFGPDTEYSGCVLMSAAEDPDGRKITIEGKEYRDGVYLFSRGGALRVVNFVSMEHYVWGVVGREMSYTYPQEALKAQAVAARSFAHRCSKHADYGFDVCATTCCQVYGGTAAENQKITDACRGCEGEMLYYGDKVVTAYYSAYSGGYTMNSEDVWGNTEGYLRAVRDEYSSEYTWATWFTFDEIRDRLLAAGYSDPGEVRSVYVSKRADNGAANVVTVEGSDRTVTFSRGNIMSVLNLKSLFFSMGPDEDPEIVRNEEPADVYYVYDAGEVLQISSDQLYVYDGRAVRPLAAGASSGMYTFTDETADGGIVYLSGVGYGHCVGMPQNGAKNMAQAGYSYTDILKYYYTDVEIR